MADMRRLKNAVFLSVITSLALVGILPIAHITGAVLYNGTKALIHAGPSFLWRAPGDPSTGEIGGIGPAISGTIALLLISMLIGFPLSFLAGVYLHEFPQSAISRILMPATNLLLEIPTVVTSMFVYLVLVVPMGRFSALAGGVALSLVMMPYVTTHVREALDAVPVDFKEAGYALGLDRAKVLFLVMLRAARRGLVTALLMAVAKSVGETAPLLFTIGGSGEIGYLGLGRPTSSVQLLIYRFAASPFPARQEAAWGASLILFLLFIGVFALLRKAQRGP